MTLKNQAIQTALQGNWQEAIAMNKSLVAQDSQDIDALNRLALAYAITGKVKEAKSTYQKVVRIDPLNPIALRNLKKIKQAFHLILEKADELKPDVAILVDYPGFNLRLAKELKKRKKDQ